MDYTEESIKRTLNQLQGERDKLEEYIDHHHVTMPVVVYNALTEEAAQINIQISILTDVLNQDGCVTCASCGKLFEHTPDSFALICAECAMVPGTQKEINS